MTQRTIIVGDRCIPWREFERASSTMDIAARVVEEGWTGWMVITALNQSAGRGTRGRDWVTHSGKGLWVSVIMPPPSGRSRMDGLTVAAAEALKETLRELTGFRFDIKQPNDVISRGKKLAGILIESTIRGEAACSFILGMGLNVAQTEDDFRAAGLPEATSLLMETGVVYDSRLILEIFLNHFLPVYEILTTGEDDPNAAKQE